VRDPQPLFHELERSGADSLITPHAYSPRYESNIQYGIYCVQFMPFTRDGSAAIRHTWQEQCLDWCSSTPDATRFGDQKYLDTWPADFGNQVRVLAHPEWTQAPWNVSRFAAEEAITFHFHRLRLQTRDRANVGLYAIPASHLTSIYRPYLADLQAGLNVLDLHGVPFRSQVGPRSLRESVRDQLEFRLHNAGHPFAPYSLRL